MKLKKISKNMQISGDIRFLVAPTAGLEPATCGLTVHRSTN